jgi:hypothetical protein
VRLLVRYARAHQPDSLLTGQFTDVIRDRVLTSDDFVNALKPQTRLPRHDIEGIKGHPHFLGVHLADFQRLKPAVQTGPLHVRSGIRREEMDQHFLVPRDDLNADL